MPPAKPININELASQAAQAAEKMRHVESGKVPEAPLNSNAASLVAVANILTALSDYARQRNGNIEWATKALDRMANLEVRRAKQLVQDGEWKKLCEELQSLAQEAATKLKAVPLALPHRHE